MAAVEEEGRGLRAVDVAHDKSPFGTLQERVLVVGGGNERHHMLTEDSRVQLSWNGQPGQRSPRRRPQLVISIPCQATVSRQERAAIEDCGGRLQSKVVTARPGRGLLRREMTAYRSWP